MTQGLKLALGVAGAIVLLLAAWSYVAHREADARLNATLEQQSQIIEQAQKKIEKLDERIAARDREWEERQKAFTELLRAAKTPQQIAVKMPEVVPGLTPPKIERDADGIERVTITAEDYRKLFEVAVTKALLEEKVVKLEADLIDVRATLKEKDVEIAALEKQRDEAVKAAKGGGFWKRLRTGLKWTAVGVAIGAALAGGL